MRKSGLFTGLAVAGLMTAGSAFGQVMLFEDNSDYDRFFMGGWTNNTTAGGWRDNIADNGDTWLATNSGHILKAPFGYDDGETDTPGFVGVFRGATGDVAEAFYTFTLPQDIAPHVPVLFEATYKATVNRLPERTTNMRTRLVNTTTGEQWVTESETLRYVSNNPLYAPGEPNEVDLYIDPDIWTADLPYTIDGPELDISNGWTTGHTGTAGDTMVLRFRQNQNDSGSGRPNTARHIGTAIGNIELVAAIAGDTNLDRQVNSADIAAIIQAGTFNTGVPATWSTGDFTGDGLVTSADIAAIIQSGQFNAGPYAARNTDNDDMTLPLDDFPYLEIDLDGSAVLTTNMVGNQGFQIISPAGTLTGTATIPPGIFVTNTVQEASTLFFQIPDVLDLGMLVADLDGFIADLAAGNVTFRVANATATGFVEGNVFVVPEPASLALLGLGGLALLRRRSA